METVPVPGAPREPLWAGSSAFPHDPHDPLTLCESLSICVVGLSVRYGVRWDHFDSPQAIRFWIRIRLKAMIWYRPGDELLERSEFSSSGFEGVYEQGKTPVKHMKGKKFMGPYAAWLNLPSADGGVIRTYMGSFADPREAARARHEARRGIDPEVEYRDILYHYFDGPHTAAPRLTAQIAKAATSKDPVLRRYSSYSYAPDFVRKALVLTLTLTLTLTPDFVRKALVRRLR